MRGGGDITVTYQASVSLCSVLLRNVERAVRVFPCTQSCEACDAHDMCPIIFSEFQVEAPFAMHETIHPVAFLHDTLIYL